MQIQNACLQPILKTYGFGHDFTRGGGGGGTRPRPRAHAHTHRKKHSIIKSMVDPFKKN
jgi:hypothetical protein